MLLLGKIKRDPDLLRTLDKKQVSRLGSDDFYDNEVGESNNFALIVLACAIKNWFILLKTVGNLQRQIENSNSNALFETSRNVDQLYGADSGFYPTSMAPSDENRSANICALPHYQQVPHYYATFAIADTSAASTVKSKKGPTKSRKREHFRQFPEWIYELLYLSADFLPRELLSSKVLHCWLLW